MKDKFKIFNNIKINTDEYEEIHFSNNDEFKDKIKSKIRGKNNLHKNKIAVVGLAILAGSMAIVSEPSLAYIKNIGQQIEHFFNREDNSLKGYKVEVNQVIEDKGIKIELKEIMLGDGELLLSLKVDDSKLDKSYFGMDKSEDTYLDLYQPKIQIGNMIFTKSGGGATIEPGDETSKNMLLTCDLNALDTNNDGEVDIEGFDLISNLDINKNYDVKIEIDRVGYTLESSSTNIPDENELPEYIEISEINGGGMNVDTQETFETRRGDVIGSWIFETSINAKKLLEDIKIYDINEEFSIQYEGINIDAIVEEVRVSPTKVKIKYSFDVEGEAVRGEDEAPIFLGFIAEDENGNEIELRGGMDLRVDEELKESMPYAEGELSSEMKSIKIIPSIDDWSKKFNSSKKFEDKAFTLE